MDSPTAGAFRRNGSMNQFDLDMLLSDRKYRETGTYTTHSWSLRPRTGEPGRMIIRRGSQICDRKSRMKKAVFIGNVAQFYYKCAAFCVRISHFFARTSRVLLSSTGTVQLHFGVCACTSHALCVRRNTIFACEILQKFTLSRKINATLYVSIGNRYKLIYAFDLQIDIFIYQVI